jgi:3-oxoacyl-[acyl-carrier protein] reductase
MLTYHTTTNHTHKSQMSTPSSWLTLSKRLAIVTGGGSGIGSAVSKSLARAGANVAILDQNLENARETSIFINTRVNAAGQGGKSSYYMCDVSNYAQVSDVVENVIKDFEEQAQLSIAVNCAGITVDRMMNKMTEGEWDKVLDVNLKGTFFMTQVTSKAM